MHKAIIFPVVCVVRVLEYEGKYRIYLKTVFLGKIIIFKRRRVIEK
jgi:hypothetical protein